MAYLPLGFPFLPPTPPPGALPTPPLRPWWPPPSPADSTSQNGVVVVVCIALVAFLPVFAVIRILCRGNHQNRADAVADAAAAAAALAWRPPPPAPEQRHNQQQPRGAPPEGRPRRTTATPAGLPSFTSSRLPPPPPEPFTYDRSARRNVTGTGDEAAAATCSLCLGAFQRGETVRLLPVCLHLFHVECVDPWLHTHSSCPLCRSGIHLPPDGGQLPPV
ncbi:hypothetical protein ACP70R_043178 [Stipagrostis hirtigluma subsp. patula]